MSEERQELRRQIDTLNDVGAMVQRVEAYAAYLAFRPRGKQSSEQKLWLVACGAVDDKMASGTETELREAALLLPILDDTIPTSYS